MNGVLHEHGERTTDAQVISSDGLSSSARANHHPTVKPIDLMCWLVRLVTPPNGIVLDPFMGSGSTGIACVREGFGFIGIEREEKYFDIACKRIEAAVKEDRTQPDLIKPLQEAKQLDLLGAAE